MRRFAALLVLVATSAQARTFGPWPEAVPPTESRRVERPPEASPVKLPFLWALWFYRNAISPLDGVRCGLYPTCSAYATEAVRRHGPLKGGFLAADRLLHEGSVRPSEYPIIEKHGRKFLHDPVEANDRLFRGAPLVPAPAVPGPVLPAGEVPRPPPAALADAELAARAASSLALAGDAYRAVTEYRRAAWLTEDGDRATGLLLEGGWTSASAAARVRGTGRLAGVAAYDEADRIFEDAGRLATVRKDALSARRAEYARALTYLSRSWFPEAERRFELVATDTRDELAADAAWLAAWSRFSRDLEEGRSSRAAAADHFAPFVDDPARGESARGVIEEAEEASWRARSPGTAMILSLVLPGSGYVYAGRPLTGLGAFVLNGAFIAGTVLAFRDGNYPLAAILLSLESGWYLGGAGGAAYEVIERNERGRKSVERRLRKRFLGTVWPGGAAGALLF